jgi:hypothetical protein
METYRDRFDGSEEATVGDPIVPEEGETIVRLLKQCPNPNDKHCRCEVHRRLLAPAGAGAAAQGDGSPTQAPPPDQTATASGSEPVLVKCPVCSVPTNSLKRYGIMHEVVFIGIAARSRRASYTACPKCMRRKVLRDTFSPWNILLANLMWVLAVFPYCIGIMIASTIPGHSASIERAIAGNE